MEKILNNKKPNKNPNLPTHIAIALVMCLTLVAIMQWDRGIFEPELREGDISLRAIYAPYDFTMKGEVDILTTEIARKKAVDEELPIYIFNAEAEEAVLKKARSIIDSVIELKNRPDVKDEENKKRIIEISSSSGISEDMVKDILKLKDHDIFFNYIKEAIHKFMPVGIISALEYKDLKDKKIKTIKVIDKTGDVEGARDVNDLFALEELKKEVENFSSSIVKDRKERSVVSDFVSAFLTVNVAYSKDDTEIYKRTVAENIQPIYNLIEVKKNEVILNKGERIGKEHIAELKSIKQSVSSAVRLGGFFGVAILLGLFVLIIGLYIKFYERDLLAGNKELLLLAVICVLILFAAKIIVVSPWPSNLIPIAVASMLIAILINPRVAIITTCFLSVLIGMIAGNKLDIAGVSLVGGMVSIFAMKGVRKRSEVIAGGMAIGLSNMSYLIGMGLIRSLDFNIYITESIFGLANGIMSAVIVTGILPIFENTFKITTDISLLELSDLNHPILKEMVMKAPGTYHHSLVVGNLAEAACEEIGANSLLARVSSYFHDIGKIEKASYFSENQSLGDATHDKLSPTMSSLIITNHVKNGVELAKKYKINKKIVDIIREHHGTGLVFYFFKRALEKVTDESIGEQSFRYPGPKPQTKEAASVLLADSVEAASRALDDPTPSRIKGLVRKIINNKFIDGQLDECDLTLKDLEKIATVFTHILTGTFHTRVGYPEEERSGA